MERYVPRLPKSCCCCCSLTLGTMIIAFVDILISLGMLSVWYRSTFERDHSDAVYVMCVAVMIVASFQLLVDVILFYAALVRQPFYVRPWLYFWALNVAVSLALVAVDAATPAGLARPISSAVNIGLKIYALLVVYSFYRKLLISPTVVAKRSPEDC